MTEDLYLAAEFVTFSERLIKAPKKSDLQRQFFPTGLLSFGAVSFIFQFTIQTFKD